MQEEQKKKIKQWFGMRKTTGIGQTENESVTIKGYYANRELAEALSIFFI